MDIFRNVKTARLWAVVFIIGFCAQMLGVGAHAGMKSDASAEVVEPCHESMSQTQASVLDDQVSGAKAGMLCCEGDCSMKNCHSNSGVAIPNSSKIFAISHSKPAIFFAPLDSISESQNSLFRPPILG